MRIFTNSICLTLCLFCVFVNDFLLVAISQQFALSMVIFPIVLFSAFVASYVVPAPRFQQQMGSGHVRLSSACLLDTAVSNTILIEGFSRMLSTIIDGHQMTLDETECMFHVEIEDQDTGLYLGVDESYEMTVSPELSLITIKAQTIWGVLHGFTTIQQLSRHQTIEAFNIKDKPFYPHRGIMLDSGRNFLTVESITEQLDIMALCKMNVLHWHLADSQSWPLKLNSHPEMALDAYSKSETYSALDLQHVVDYAKKRGIRVIPEIDMPGHARAGWKRNNSELVVCGNSEWDLERTAVEPPAGQLNPLSAKTYQVIQEVYLELTDIFPDNLFHVGGDEVSVGCYNSSSEIRQWLLDNNHKNLTPLIDYWLARALPIFDDRKERRLVMWEDIVLSSTNASDLLKNVILQSWKNYSNIQALTTAGYDVIVSSSSFFYLDCGVGTFLMNDYNYVENNENFSWNYRGLDSWCGPYKTWQRIYSFNETQLLEGADEKHILGYEAPLWSEQVDSHVLTQKLWPRAAALAELSWSGNLDAEGHIRLEDFGRRLLNFREMLVSLGYHPAPIAPKFCWYNPDACKYFF